MKKMPLKLHLSLIFGGLFLAVFFTMGYVIKTQVNQLTTKHIVELTEMHHERLDQRITNAGNRLNFFSKILQRNHFTLTSNQENTFWKGAFTEFFIDNPYILSILFQQQDGMMIEIDRETLSTQIHPRKHTTITAKQTWWSSDNTNLHLSHDNQWVYLSEYLPRIKSTVSYKTSINDFFSIGITRNNTMSDFILIGLPKQNVLLASPIAPQLPEAIIEKVIQEDELSYQIADGTGYRLVYNLLSNNKALGIIQVIPERILSQDFNSILYVLLKNLIIVMVVSMLVVYLISGFISTQLKKLNNNAKKIRNFDFSPKHYPDNVVIEIQSLSSTLSLMEETIERMLELINHIASSRDFDDLNQRLTNKVSELTNGETCLLLIDKGLLVPSSQHNSELTERCLQQLKDNERLSQLNHDGPIIEYLESANCTLYHFGLLAADNTLLGCLSIELTPEHAMLENKIHFIQRFLRLAEITVFKMHLMQQQKNLLNSFIQVIASAIDTKSPHTGGHCQRVPELTLMLAKTAHHNEGDWQHFRLSTDEWEELHLAAWLHDCGKLTTADHVIDKATKLDMFYNRIHEIRTRFEVLKRDTHIHCYQQIEAGIARNDAEKARDSTLQQLDDDFTFVAKANIGGEYFSDDDHQQLKRISQYIFTRTINKAIGTSWEEQQRLGKLATQCNIDEFILQDNIEHLISWDDNANFHEEESFTLTPCDHKFNHGELYNLAVSRGTLTNEERYLINDHIVQTIVMLKALPYPHHLKNVPTIAGGHHEQMSGKGYPYSIKASTLPITARILAIADIFEALTANDRPYKKAKTLSESLTIMAFMVKNDHIDKELYKLFIESGVYLEYYTRFLSDTQYDNVDKTALFELAGIIAISEQHQIEVA